MANDSMASPMFFFLSYLFSEVKIFASGATSFPSSLEMSPSKSLLLTNVFILMTGYRTDGKCVLPTKILFSIPGLLFSLDYLAML